MTTIPEDPQPILSNNAIASTSRSPLQPTSSRLGVPLSRPQSRIGTVLSRIRTGDAHPPHHAHFDDSPSAPIPMDIEHVPVDDDPREWSDTKKNIVLAMMTLAVVRDTGNH
jgi:hypothetical protein